MINNYFIFLEANWDFRIAKRESLLSVIKCFIFCKCCLSLVSLSLSAFHLATSTSLPIPNFQYSLSLFVSWSWTGAVGHADSLSLLFCRRENCHPCHSGLWTQHGECIRVWLCVCVLRRLWRCGVRRERGFISSARNSWMHVHSQTPSVYSEGLKHDASSTSSTLRGKPFRERNFAPEDMWKQQKKRGLEVSIVSV